MPEGEIPTEVGTLDQIKDKDIEPIPTASDNFLTSVVGNFEGQQFAKTEKVMAGELKGQADAQVAGLRAGAQAALGNLQ